MTGGGKSLVRIVTLREMGRALQPVVATSFLGNGSPGSDKKATAIIRGIWCSLLLAATASVCLLWSGGTSAPPISLKYVGPQEGHTVSLADEVTFWVTNNTSKALLVRLNTIEVRGPSGWTTFSFLPTPNIICYTSSMGIEDLPPHTARYGFVLGQVLRRRAILPTNSVWRVRGMADERLTGGRASFERLKMQILARFGIGSARPAGVTKRTVMYGPHRGFASPELPPL